MHQGTEPLTDAERTLAEERLRSYRRTAWMFTGLVGLIVIAFVVKAISGAGHGSEPWLYGVLGGAAAGAGVLAWYFGWRQVLALCKDIEKGLKERLSGEVTWLDRQGNAYGQTVTHVRVAGRQASSREASMTTIRKGDRLELMVLPTSGVVLSFRPLDQTH